MVATNGTQSTTQSRVSRAAAGPPASERIRVLVADGHVPTRVGVRVALERNGLIVCAEAGDAAGAVRGALDSQPEICLLDVSMPGGGVAAARQIKTAVPQAAVVMFSASLDEDDLFDALRAGADGYLLKETDPDRLHLALAATLEGEPALPRRLVARLIMELRGRRTVRTREFGGRHATRLTRREHEVLELMHEGAKTSEVARRLGISPVTVRRHVSAGARKLGVADRTAAVGLLSSSG